MSITLRDTIKETVRYHLTEEKGLAMGQCLTAVGWVGGQISRAKADMDTTVRAIRRVPK